MRVGSLTPAGHSFADVLARIEALEAKAISLGDLPLRALQDKLELDWQPDAAALLGGQGLARGGLDGVTFTAATLSAAKTVAHGLSRRPVAVVATAYASPAVDQIALLNTLNWNDVSFQVTGEVDLAYTGTIQFSWVAL